MDLKEIERENGELINPNQERRERKAVVNKVQTSGFHKIRRNVDYLKKWRLLKYSSTWSYFIS
jgi:hypothetical protein